tara:strand:+ start:292 stop:4650 length:4359 start_codon:yes stop_codon:yes gene_type:complete
MSQKTFMVESNNTSGKLFTDRARKNARIGKNFVEEQNAQWTTTINQGGLQINPGDTISISSTQINLRGEPDQCLEFSGSTNSTFKDQVLDNKVETEFGFYITNRQQYNMNLPLISHKTVDNESWFKKYYTMPRVLDSFIDGDALNWKAFHNSYPCASIEGCAKRHCSTAFGSVESDSAAGGGEDGIIMTYWDVLDPGSVFQQNVQGQQGLYFVAYDDTLAVPIANGNFTIASPNETRMYVCGKDYAGTMNDNYLRSGVGPSTYAETLIVQDITFEVPEGFITPTSLGSDLTTVFHERLGDADNWATESVETSVYVHDTPWYNQSLVRVPNVDPGTPYTAIEALGYYQEWYDNRNVRPYADRKTFKLTKIPVSDITDKSYITINTSTGALLDKIYQDPNVAGSEAEWKDFGANIPNNKHFYWGGSDPADSKSGDGKWGENYDQVKGAELFYNNLLTGDINRTQAIEVWNTLMGGNNTDEETRFNENNLYAVDPTTNLALYQRYINALALVPTNPEAAADKYTLGGTFTGNAVYWNAGKHYNGVTDPLRFEGIFGSMICVMDNYVDVKNISPYADPNEKFNNGIFATGFNNAAKPRNEWFPETLSCDSIRPGQDFQVIPLNILASPLNIATVKKALYRAREVMPNSKQTLNSDSWTESYVTRLDLGFKDDAMCINANIPNGYNNPVLSTNMISCPNPYMVAQGFKNGYVPLDPTDPTIPPTAPTFHPTGLNSYQTTNVSAVDSTGFENNGMPRIVKDGRQNIQFKNSIYARTFWNEDCDPKNGNIKLPEGSQFSFKNGDGEMPDYTKWFRPGGFDDAPEEFKNGTSWLDGNERELDEGVGLCVVYYNERTMADTPSVNQPSAAPNQDKNAFYTDITYPPIYPEDIRLPGINIPSTGRLVPFLAIVTPKFTAENEYGGYKYNQRIVPCPYIGEPCGFSSTFSDGKYAKVVTTQRVNPKSYETINESITEQNTKFLPQAYLFDSQYYNIYDYYPYIHIGATDPKIQFSDTSGRFEISQLHTPATSSNGAWQDPPSSGAGEQSSDEVIIMNGRRSFVSHASAAITLKGFQQGRLDKVADLIADSDTNLMQYAKDSSVLYQVSDNIPIIPWGEIRQDTYTSKTISSQSGLGLLNYFYFSTSDNAATARGALSAFTPQIYNETMFAKMGFSMEQLLPFGGSQNNNFNRSNYNKYLGVDSPLLLKNNNMLYPFTTNGYSTAIQSFDTTTNSWIGYDTCWAVNAVTNSGKPDKGEPPTTDPYSFYEATGSGMSNIGGRPQLTFQTSFGDNSSANLKELPPNEALTMYSLGGNSFGNESIATVDSDALIANSLPSKFNYSYLVIYSDIVGQSSNFITGSNLMITTPAIGYMTRNYSSADFMYSFDSDFNYTADRSFLLNNFNVEIRQPNGRLANIENNSTIIFKIVKNIRPILPIPQPVMKQIEAQDKEDEKEMDLTIKEFV